MERRIRTALFRKGEKYVSKIVKLAAVAAYVALGTAGASAQAPGMECQAPQPVCQRVTAYLAANVKPWVSDPVIVNAVKAQNLTSTTMSPADITKLDAGWTDKSNKSLIESRMNNALSTFLKAKKAAGGPAMLDLLVFDDKGLNVGQTDMTQDYNQGDEAKYSKTFSVGPDAVFIDKISSNAGKNTLQANLSIKDPQTGAAIGAMTVGLDVDALK